MGFIENTYNVLSPGAGSLAAPWIDHQQKQQQQQQQEQQQQKQEKEQQQQQEVVSLDCKSWILGQIKGFKIASASSSSSSSSSSSNSGSYKRPPKWKRFFRKCRVQSRKLQSSCYESVCVEPKPLHHYKTESYERNFDRGREYWQDLPFLDISPFYSPVASNRCSNACASSYDSSLHKQQQQQQQQHNLEAAAAIFNSSSYDPWQRRLSAPLPSNLKDH